MNCPSCKSENTGVLETRLRADGVRRRRYKCFTCLDRWSEFEQPSGDKADAVLLPKQPARRRLTPKDAEEILLSEESRGDLARRFNVTRETIRKILTRETYADVYKRLVMEGKLEAPSDLRFCEMCVHWTADRGCDFGFPDAGGEFATDCYLFRQL